MEIGWTEIVILFIILLFTSRSFRLFIRKAIYTFTERFNSNEYSSNNTDHSSWASSSNDFQRYHSNNESANSTIEQEDQDPYKILNIQNSATKDEITSAYRKLAQIYHPDKVSGLAPEYREIAERKMREINTAYQTLKK
jgi:DnaJ-class molecular chaperone